MRLPCLAILLTAGCGSLRSEARSAPPLDEASRPAYRIWHEGELWRLRAAAGPAKHRFQGSADGLTGGILDVRPTRRELSDRVALDGNSVQFDFDIGPGGEAGFDARVTGGCLRFDLYIDEHHRPERVRVGPAGQTPSRLPAVTCP